ncbi:MAG: AAA family ATPase [Nitrosopumilus sp.]|nr:AAA family ATPase [Nitrosopumilus sp.]
MSIVISGNPGTGKHTIAQQIAQRLDLSIVDINEVAKSDGLFEKNNGVNDVNIKKLEKILRNKISEKNLIVGHLAPYVLDINQVKTMIILRRDPYELISVYKERKYTDNKIRDNTGSEILGIIAYDAISKFNEKMFQINNSWRSVEETVEKIMSLIAMNINSEEVDWLSLVTENNDLEKFFGD